VQSTIPNPLVSSVPVTHLVQLVVSKNVSVSSSIPPITGQVVPLSWGQNLSVSMVSGTTNVSSSQAHMVGMNQPSSGIIQNPTSPAGSSNVQYQQVQNPVGTFGSRNFHYQ